MYRVLALCLLVSSLPSLAEPPSPTAPPLATGATSTPSPATKPAARYCVWPAVGGAVAGVAVAWYGFVGLMAASGRDAFALPSDAGTIAAIVGLEWAGMTGGAIGGCAIWGHEARWWPTAASVITGGVVGGGALTLAGFWLASAAGLGRNTDNPVDAVLVITGLAALGVGLGGWGGYQMDLAGRGPPGGGVQGVTLLPFPAPGGGGIAISGRW